MKKRTRLLSLVLAIAMIFTMMPISLTASAAETITISTAEQLMSFAKRVNDGDTSAISANVTLSTDVDLTGKTWVPIGTKDYPFLGTFDGNGKTISGINCTNAYKDGEKEKYNSGAYGLFGYVGNKDDGAATISNVIISNSTFVLGGTSVLFGAVVGKVASQVGTTATQSNVSSVSQCGVTSSVNVVANLTGGTNALGGVVGVLTGSLSECDSRANINLSTGKKNVNCHVGGVVGRADIMGITITLLGNKKTEIADAYFAGRITSDSTSKKCYVGGVLGGSLDKTSLTDLILELAGLDTIKDIATLFSADEPTIDRVYSAGTLSAAKCGGVAGYNCGGIFADTCYYHADSAPYAYIDEDVDSDEITQVAGNTFTTELDYSKLKKSLISNNFEASTITGYPYPTLKNVDDNFKADDQTAMANSEGSVYNPKEIKDVATLKAVANNPSWSYKVIEDISGFADNVKAYFDSLSDDQKKAVSKAIGNASTGSIDVYTAVGATAAYDDATTYYLDQSGTVATKYSDFTKVYAFKDGETKYYTASGDPVVYNEVDKSTGYVAGTTYYIDEYGTLAADSDFDISYKFTSGTTYYTKEVVPTYSNVELSELLALDATKQAALITAGLATAANFSNSFAMDPIPSFTGSINGQNHKITGMTINIVDTDGTKTNAALFENNFGQVKDLTFENTTVSIDASAYETVDGTYSAATVAAKNYGTISNVKTDATITGTNGVVGSKAKATYLGGIAAINYGNVTSAENTGVVLFKLAENSIFDDSTNQNYDKVLSKSAVSVGGLVGRNNDTGLVSGQSVNTARSELIGPKGVNVGQYCGYNANDDDKNSVTGTSLDNSLASSNFLVPYDPGSNASTEDKSSTPATTGIAMGKGTLETGYPTVEVRPADETYDLTQRVVIVAKDTDGNTYNVTYFRDVKIALADLTLTISDSFEKYYAINESFSTSGISLVAFKGKSDERKLSKVDSAEKQGYTVHIYTDPACTNEVKDKTFTVAGKYYVQLKYGDNILKEGLNSPENRTDVPVYNKTIEVFDVSTMKITSTNYDLYMAGQTPKLKVSGTIKLGTDAKADTKTVSMESAKYPYDIYIDGTLNGTLSFNPKKTTDTKVVDGKIYYSDEACKKVVEKPKTADIATYYEATAEVYVKYTYDYLPDDGLTTPYPTNTITSEKTFVNVAPSNIKVNSFTAENSSGADPTVKCNNIELEWTSDYGDDIKYNLYRKVSGAEDTEYKKISSKTYLSYTDDSAVPGTTYVYKVVMVIGGAESTGSETLTILCPLPTSVVAKTKNVRAPLNGNFDVIDGVIEVIATWKNNTNMTLSYGDSASETFDTLNYAISLDNPVDTTVVNSEYTATVMYKADGTNLTAVKSVDDNTKDATFKIIVSPPTGISVESKYDCYPSGYEASYFINHVTVTAVYNYSNDATAKLYYEKKLTNSEKNSGVTFPDYDSSKGNDRVIKVKWQYATGAFAEGTVKVNFCDLLDPTLSVTTGGTGQNTITWPAVDGADSYIVYRKSSTETEYDKVKTVKPDGNNALEYTDKKSEPGVVYTYKVETKMADRTSAGAVTTPITTVSPDFIKLVSKNDNAKISYAIGDEYKKPTMEVIAFYKIPGAVDYVKTTDTELDDTKTYYVVDENEDSGYKAVAAADLDVAKIDTYYVTEAHTFSDADFANVEKSNCYSQRELKYSATAEAYKYQVDSSAFKGDTAGTYTIVVKYADDANYKGQPIGSYDVNVYGIDRLSVTTNAKSYPDTTDFNDVVFTVKAVYGNDTVTAKEEVLTSSQWQITGETPDMTVAGAKTVTIQYLVDGTPVDGVTGTAKFNVYDPDATITPADDSGITRDVVTIGTEDKAALVVNPASKDGVTVGSFIVDANFAIPTSVASLDIFTADGTKIVAEDYDKTKVGTGFVVKLYASDDTDHTGTPIDEAIVIIKGDLNGDGKIKAVDAKMALDGASGEVSLSEIKQLAADINLDEKIRAVDAKRILDFASGVSSTLVK